ncbi:GPI mannosyltransferase 1 [Hetaerina americana]|uniref:GPI mannosyltransferase 1 n=1 Tax=Hetaerina americana TaxID=62018 RepID=UPI003A7F24CB
MKLMYHFYLALLLRLLLVIYGEWQDANFNVSYTDVDYHVFTDAARYMSSGGSPYQRSTYRYPPILAAILLPNIWVHRSFGKILFATFDVIAGGLGVLMSGCTQSKITLFLCLYSPLNAVISTRGSADSLSSALVISSIMAVGQGHVVAAGVVLALAAHLRVYPILFVLPMWLSLTGDEASIHPLKACPQILCIRKWLSFIYSFITEPQRCYFLVTFMSSLAILTTASYAVYGHEFLQESYLYHFTRVDIRHNFSVNFYMFLLSGNILPSIISFLPQLIVIVLLGVKYGTRKDLPFACFCQVYIFVVFNKVITAQYFIWPLSIFPIVTPMLRGNQRSSSQLGANDTVYSCTLNKFVLRVGQWLLSVALWLYSAYNLEFLGLNTFFYIWTCSLMLFGTNVFIIKELVKCYDCNTGRKELLQQKSQ